MGYATIEAKSEEEAMNLFNKDPDKYRGIAKGDTQEQIIGVKFVRGVI